jgi:hypothetical protein
MPKCKSNSLITVNRDAANAYKQLLLTVLQSCSIPDRDKLLGHLRAGHYARLLEWADTIDPQKYESAASYFAECQVAAFIRKYPFTNDEVPGINPRAAAIKKFFAAEHRCKRQNQRRRSLRKNFDPHFQKLEFAREYIVATIGIKPDIAAITSKCDFAAGASLGVHGNRTNAMRKLFAKQWTVTPSALPYALIGLWKNVHTRECILPGALVCYGTDERSSKDYDEFRSRVLQKVKLVSCNNISFVTKTALTDRSIAVEPLLNGFVQKGADEYLRDVLLRQGINLRDQRVNQLLARSGSMSDFDPFCTIDLSAASDSLSTELVRDLLPAEWFEFLSNIRAPWYKLDNSTRRYEKFCSMGNGFCFPLQTLIFASVCHAVSRFFDSESPVASHYDFSVYGDDIVVKQHLALATIELLRDIGFKTNRDKTFVTGPFRESCGSDWYNGQDVRPVHCDKRLVDIRQVFALHNSILRSQRCESFLTEASVYLRTLSPLPFYRPGREPGDTCFSVPLDVAMTSKFVSWRKASRRWAWREILTRARRDSMDHLNCVEHAKALMYAAMRGATSREPYTVRHSGRPVNRRVSRWWIDAYPWSAADHDAVKSVKECRKVVRGI